MSFNNQELEDFKDEMMNFSYNSQADELWYKGNLLTKEEKEQFFDMIKIVIN